MNLFLIRIVKSKINLNFALLTKFFIIVSFCVSHFTVAEYHFQQTFQMLKKMCHSKEVIKK